jgi:glutaredoxin 3
MFDFLNPLWDAIQNASKPMLKFTLGKPVPYCIRAKMLLWWKGVNYTEYKIDGDEAA